LTVQLHSSERRRRRRGESDSEASGGNEEGAGDRWTGSTADGLVQAGKKQKRRKKSDLCIPAAFAQTFIAQPHFVDVYREHLRLL
jgi:hypothetical protein